MEKLAQHIEALIFTTEHPVSLKEIKASLDVTFETAFKEEDLLDSIQQLTEQYKNGAFSFEVIEVAEGYQFMTKPEYHAAVGTYLKQTTKKRLSQAALETLSIIAYKQPIGKTELESIRGVSCDYSIQKLLEKELIEIAGRSDSPGRPLLYATSQKFMDYFGLKSLRDLPKTKDFKDPDSEIGEQAPIDVESGKVEE
jgi:segregation and condensation protein B